MAKYVDINRPGFSIKCKIYCDSIRDIKEAVIYVHGFGGHKETKAAEHFADTLMSKRKKAAVICFDLPCHGTDVKKKVTLEDCNLYLETVLDYVKNDLHAETIFAYGTSFGGYLLLKYLKDHNENPFKKIALRCPAVPMYETMCQRILTEENLALIEKGKSVEAGFDRMCLVDKEFFDSLKEEDIRKYEYFDYADDILIIQGNKDELIPLSVVKAFAEDNVINFIELDGADHRFQNLDKLKLSHSYIMDFFFK